MRFSKKEEYLCQKDKKIKKIIETNGHIFFKPIKKNQFDTLVGIIVSQFISTSAANTIFENIKKYFDTQHLSEENFQDLDISKIKKLGLSTNKARTIKELSELFLNKDFDDLAKMDNATLNSTLLSIFGVGPWSVNMFEIFCIGKLNVFSSRDAGLRLAMNKSNMVEKNSKLEKYDIYANNWSPFKTIASLHLWKSVD